MISISNLVLKFYLYSSPKFYPFYYFFYYFQY